MPVSLRPVLTTVLACIEEVHAGRLDPRVGTAVAALAGAACRLYQVAELEQRLAALEAATGEGWREAR